ncbi:exopolysaccharide biosynthesis polyprenyl glycosylphosphotransferase [uncultured Sphingomonas sp.]|uniref:exopolysaccharide biosynthesis polyprenyl glycosylphosphotransferase n=1 Tax=uncultured Sphingomonas sp. TaxID=158754 RepID=UPI0025ED8382|nr:exopolysaccharide biosynthesis polyprenyl glycosylphosphotransferase [uncultured Sphingomonas sp.]
MNGVSLTSVQDDHSQTHPLSRYIAADKERLRLRGYVILAIGDSIALAIAFLLANYLYLRDLSSPHGLTMLTAVLPIYLILAAYNRAYSGITLENARVGCFYAAQTLLWTAAAVLFFAYFLKAGDQFSRIVFTLGGAGGIFLICAARIALAPYLLRMLGGSPFTTIVIRDGVDYAPGAHEVVVTAQDVGFDPDTQDPYLYHAFATSVESADRLIIACPQARYPSWSAVLKSLSVDGEILTDQHHAVGILGIGRHGNRQTLVVSAEPLHLRQRIFKRVFDIVFASVALILLSPLLLVTAIAIRLETSGPIFFRQDRIGRDNRIFKMYKFRSMHAASCDTNAAQLTRRGDARVTRVGAFIREHSIDELPQLLNVLNGTMSVVGPRPHAIAAKAGDLLYWHADDRYRFRHSIKPGLTGLAQIRGFRGATDRVEDLSNRLSADLEYLSQWSIALDIWIILQTFGVLRHNNAY